MVTAGHCLMVTMSQLTRALTRPLTMGVSPPASHSSLAPASAGPASPGPGPGLSPPEADLEAGPARLGKIQLDSDTGPGPAPASRVSPWPGLSPESDQTPANNGHLVTLVYSVSRPHHA